MTGIAWAHETRGPLDDVSVKPSRQPRPQDLDELCARQRRSRIMSLSLHRKTGSRPGTQQAEPDRRPNSPMRAGGVAALVQAAAFVFGFVIYGTVIANGDYTNLAIDPSRHVNFLGDNQLVLHVWYAVIYLVFGGALVVLAPVIGDRVRPTHPSWRVPRPCSV
jgi:hypothetical protein